MFIHWLKDHTNVCVYTGKSTVAVAKHSRICKCHTRKLLNTPISHPLMLNMPYAYHYVLRRQVERANESKPEARVEEQGNR